MAHDLEDLPDLGAIGFAHADDQRAGIGLKNLATHQDFMPEAALFGMGGAGQRQHQGAQAEPAAGATAQRWGA